MLRMELKALHTLGNLSMAEQYSHSEAIYLAESIYFV